MAELLGNGGEGGVTESRGRVLPLNSKRLTKANLQSLANGLGVSPNASAEQLRLKEPRNIQVVSYEVEPGSEHRKLSLKDDDGVFLEVEGTVTSKSIVTLESLPLEVATTLEPAMNLEITLAENADLKEELRQLEGEMDAVREALEEQTRKASQLEEELERSPPTEQLDKLQRDLQREKDKTKNMWRMNCEQLAYFDDELAAKDEEIAELKQRIATMTTTAAGTAVTDLVVRVT